MRSRIELEGILIEDPVPYSAIATKEVCAEFWIWHTPDYPDGDSGFDGVISRKVRILVVGRGGQAVLHGDHGERGLGKEDHIMITGDAIWKVVRFWPKTRPNSRPKRYKFPHHTIYVEVQDDDPAHGIVVLGRISLKGAGLMMMDDNDFDPPPRPYG